MLLIFASCFVSLGTAQTAKGPQTALFTPENQADWLQKAAARPNTGKGAAVYQLKYTDLKNALRNAPLEYTEAAQRGDLQIAVPEADGRIVSYKVWETALMHPDLAAKFPEIRSYAGCALDEPSKTIHFTISPDWGLHAIISRADLHRAYIEPLTWGATDRYVVFDRAALPADQRPPLYRLNKTDYDEIVALKKNSPVGVQERGGAASVRMKIFRLAVSCTGEFSLDHGGTVASTLAALLSYTNEINIAFERDIALRLQLFSEQEKLIFTDPGGDPFFGQTVQEFAAQNNNVIKNYVGFDNFDIGHVYARYISGTAAGVAGGLACTNAKATGCSADNGTGRYSQRFVDVIGQELGHQFTGGHTWNRCEEIGGRSPQGAFEPGSGTTIMSYGGVCASDNVTNGTDTYYHTGSIDEISRFNAQTGPTCGSWLETTNNAPVVELPYTDGFYIPISTPFELNGSANDPDPGDNAMLTYCWEQMDLGPICPIAAPQGNAPLYRSFPPNSKSNRVFPQMSQVLGGFNTSRVEHTPTYTRDLTFRLTARDNRTGGGGVGHKDVAFQAFEGAGPFAVTAPNNPGITWREGDYVRIAWSVNNTDKAPVNCANVNILISTNAGNTYAVLAGDTPNDGLEYVRVPDLGPAINPSVRIRINAANNVFFDVSDRNLRIEASTKPNLSLSTNRDAAVLCLPAKFSAGIAATATNGLTGTAQLAVVGNLPQGAVVKFSNDQLVPDQGTSQMEVDMSNVREKGTYTFQVRAIIPGQDTALIPYTIRTVYSDFSAVRPLSPLDGATGVGLNQTVRWQTSPYADRYDVQVSTDPAFRPNDIIASASALPVDSFKIPVFLTKGTPYYWRVRAVNECNSQWNDPAFFSTFAENCSMVSAGDLPKNISSNGTPTVESLINVLATGTVGSVSVKTIKGSHQFFRELEMKLIAPDNTELVLIKNKCSSYNGNFNFGLSDLAPAAFACPPNNAGGTYKPENPLSVFKGKNINGTWKLSVKDGTVGSSGSLAGFALEFCTSAALNPPVLVKNAPLQINSGETKGISQSLLQATDANNTPAQLTFILVTTPRQGTLYKSGAALAAGDRFTQADIDAGAIQYTSNSNSQPSDYFKFVVSDGEGGFVATPIFVINTTVDASEPTDLSGSFRLAPNPTQDAVLMQFGRPLSETTLVRLFDAAGRLVQSLRMDAGAVQQPLSLGALPAGLYWLRVENTQGAGVQRIVKQ